MQPLSETGHIISPHVVELTRTQNTRDDCDGGIKEGKRGRRGEGKQGKEGRGQDLQSEIASLNWALAQQIQRLKGLCASAAERGEEEGEEEARDRQRTGKQMARKLYDLQCRVSGCEMLHTCCL